MDNIPVLGIHEIAFEVRDLERCIAFYRDILGYPCIGVGRSKPGFVSERSV
jgi:catechol-2,3-dioxygenase